MQPEDQVDEIVEHYPGVCRGCGREFSACELEPAGRFGRHQVAELPPISVLLIEHRTRRVRCPGCRIETTAKLPAEIGSSAFGPRLRAAIVTLTARNRISRRGASELAGEMFGAKLSTGTVEAICQHASDALEGPHTHLRAWVLGQSAVHVDETGWRTAGDSRALWTMTAPSASIFQIAEHCNREQFNQLIGPFGGIIVSDRWPGYEHLQPDRRQVCWSHLQRDFRRHSRTRRATDLRRGWARAHRPSIRSLARLPRAPRPASPQTKAQADPARATTPARARRAQQQTHPLSPRVR
jgi:transposase